MLAELVGRLSQRSPAALLRLCEERRFSGEIEFEAPGSKGALRILGGFVEDGRLDAGGDAVETFLGLPDGRFRLRQRLPTPAGGFVDEPVCGGPIGPHLPAELLRFCETVGLTGTLSLANGGRHVQVAYRLGEIDSISLDGRTEADLQEAWGWTVGEWTISSEPFVEPRTPARPDETGRQFLDVVEHTLSAILSQAQQALPPPRRESLAAAIRRRTDDTASRRIELPPLSTSLPPPPRMEPTVRIYYLRELVPSPVLAAAPRRRTISRTDLTEELVDIPAGIRVGDRDPARTPMPPAPDDAPSPWPYVLATIAVALVTALVLWILD